MVVLDGVQDPGNAGAILRTAEAFGATGAVFLKGTVSPSNPKCLRASAGSAFRLPIVTEIPRRDSTLYAADPRAKLSVADARLARSLRHRHWRRGKRCAARAGRARYRRENSDRQGGIAERGGCGRHPTVRSTPPTRPRMSLFDSAPLPFAGDEKRPLAERMRPERLEDFVGQQHILGPGKPLRMQIERDQLQSMILWGPPGTGKTTLARLVARMSRCEFVPFSAVLSGIKEIKAVMAGRRTSPPRGPQDPGLCRRDSPLQQSPAGCVSALRRERRHYPDRRHHRESVFRSGFGAALALQGVRSAGALDGRNRNAAGARP